MNPRGFEGLQAQDVEHLLDTFEGSLRIQTRSQFYLWAQGALQRYMAHETLWCGHGDVARQQLQQESFSRFVMDASAERESTSLAGMLLPRMAEDWQRNGRVPRYFGSPRQGPGLVERRQLVLEIARRGFGHVLAHGAREIRGAQGSFFVFVRMPQPPGPRELYLADLLMPYLHMALHRMLANEEQARPAAPGPRAPLTRRELQVLQWVKGGKTNEEIAHILDVSPTTVKNHVQKILRKLQVSNRAQAVGRADALALFNAGNERVD